MRIEDSINLLDEMLDHSWSLPLSGGKSVVDLEEARRIIDDIRENMPIEIEQAEALINRRDEILGKAKEEAEAIIRKAEERARALLAQDEAVKAAQQKATDILSQSQTQSKEMRIATHHFADNLLRQTEESLFQSLEELRKTRQALRGSAKQE